MLRVTVDPIWTEKNLQIAEQMSDDKNDQDDSSDRDNYFLSNGRTIESGENIHDKLADCQTRRLPQIMNAAWSVKAARIKPSQYKAGTGRQGNLLYSWRRKTFLSTREETVD